MKLKEFSLSVFSLVIIGFLFLGFQNIHFLTCHSSDDNDIVIHSEQCEFVYSNNHTSFLNFGCLQIALKLFNNIKVDFVVNYKEPQTQSLCKFYFFNRPPPFLV